MIDLICERNGLNAYYNLMCMCIVICLSNHHRKHAVFENADDQFQWKRFNLFLIKKQSILKHIWKPHNDKTLWAVKFPVFFLNIWFFFAFFSDKSYWIWHLSRVSDLLITNHTKCMWLQWLWHVKLSHLVHWNWSKIEFYLADCGDFFFGEKKIDVPIKSRKFK